MRYGTMITIPVKEYNTFTQDFYDSVIFSLQFQQLKCSKCGHSACLTIHGYYRRSIAMPEGMVSLRICRVKCSECGHTHALLLSSIVPYSRIAAADQHKVVCAYENGTRRNCICDDNPSVDENNVKSIIRRYRHFWLQRRLAESIPLMPLSELIRRCFSHYSVQFMQIHRTSNRLFPDTT